MKSGDFKVNDNEKKTSVEAFYMKVNTVENIRFTLNIQSILLFLKNIYTVL